MKTQAFNPYLPGWEYVPDGEPYVFGDRLYVFGSHDEFNSTGFCTGDYVCWSAPVDDLGNWSYEGIIYRKTQDPSNPNGKMVMNAPDVCVGPDGRYYLYYQLHLETVTSVAVADTPAGPYEYYGKVKWPDGSLYGSKKTDAYNFDPGMLADDDGRIYMYTGFSPDKGFMRTIMGLRGNTFDGGTVVELEPDMLTVKGEPVPTVPGEVRAKGTPFRGHGFFEASSIRKINGKYYLVYSSVLSHELCYATSDSPMGEWTYGGTIVSIGDIGLPGVTKERSRNYTGNTHGGMVEVNGQWYIFYHRQTNKQKCCRQGCAEPIAILPDGSIPQVEVTSCGLNGGPLNGTGAYEARIACNLGYLEPAFGYLKTREKDKKHPFFTQSGEDREENGSQYIANMRNGAWCAFKYFEFNGENKLTVKVRGEGGGRLMVSTARHRGVVARIPIDPGEDWHDVTADLTPVTGKQALYFAYIGPGCIDFDSFRTEKE